MAADTLKAQAQSRDLKVGHFIVEFATPGHRPHAEECRLRFRAVRHRAFGLPQRDDQERLRYFEAARLPAIVRVPSKEYHHIARAADMGAEGIMLPMVNDAEEARQILDCMKYVPRRPARRGAGRGARPLPGRRRAGQARRRQRAHHLLRPDRDPGRRRERRRHRRPRRGRLPVGRPFRPVGVAGHPGPVRAQGLPGRDRHRGRAPAASTARPPAGWCRRRSTGADYNAKGFDFICYSGDVWAYQAAVKAGVDGIRAGASGSRQR